MLAVILLSIVCHFCQSLGFTYFCYPDINLALPCLVSSHHHLLMGLVSISDSSHLGAPEKLVVDCWIMNLLSESATLLHLLFLLVLPHSCLPVHTPLIISIMYFYKATIHSLLLHHAVFCCRDDCIPHSLL